MFVGLPPRVPDGNGKDPMNQIAVSNQTRIPINFSRPVLSAVLLLLASQLVSADQPEGPTYNHRTYATATKDFRSFTPTRLFFDGSFNVIDATMLHAEREYYLIAELP
jgi:hypothetical protein